MRLILSFTVIFSFISLAYADKEYVDPSKRIKHGLLEEAPVESKKMVDSKEDKVSNKKMTKRERRIEKVCSCHMLKLMSSYTNRLCKDAVKKDLTEDQCYFLYQKGTHSSYYTKAKKAAGKLSGKYDIDIEDECEDYEDQMPRNKRYRKMKKIIKKWHADKCDTDVILSL